MITGNRRHPISDQYAAVEAATYDNEDYFEDLIGLNLSNALYQYNVKYCDEYFIINSIVPKRF